MRFLQLVTSETNRPSDPAHIAKLRQSIHEAIASGTLLATGGLGQRATAAARIICKAGRITVEDPPTGDGWMAAGGYALCEFASKEAAIESAKAKFDIMGDGTIELIQVSDMHPAPNRAAQPSSSSSIPGVIAYLSIDGANEAAAFYQRAFGATVIASMAAQDGKRLMHCHLEINGGAFMLADAFPEMGGPPVQRSPSYTMQLVVSDGDGWWKRAIAAGCIEKMPFAVAPWGDKYGQLVDPFGVTWAINSPAAATR